jgi:serine/threonine-protein kinase
MLAVAVISMAAYFVNRTASLSAPITITVLPFYNTAADSAIDLIASGLADEVASALARVRGIQIVSRNGARAYRGQLTVNVAEVAKTLKAEYVMTGSVRQEDGRWLLSAVVERGVDAASLWDSTFNVSPDQQVGAAEAIAGSLTSALRERFPKSIGPVTVLAANERTLNPEAYRLNMRGQEILTRRSQTVKEGVDLFRKAIREDPRYAQAYSGLSMALSLTAYMDGVPMRDLHDDLVGAARRAIELDSTLAQPHVALGVAYWFDYSWDKAEAEFKNAIRLDGRNVEARIQYARHLRFRGQNSDAMRELRVARALDPMSAVVLSHLAYSYSLDLQLDSALKESGRAWEMDPTNVTTVGYRALILLRVNRPEEARALVNARRPSLNTDRYVLARVDPVAARQRLQELDVQRPQRWGAETNRVMIYLGVGDTALALSALERATDSNEIWHAGAVGYSDPLFDAVRGSARFQATLRRVRLAR